MKTELFISWRYLITKRKQRFIWLMSLISVLGIAIGVMALIVVISVMTGFNEDLKDKITGNISHIQIERNLSLSEYNNFIKKIKEIKGVYEVSPYILGQVFLNYNDRFFSLALKGIEPQTEVRISKIKEYLIKGDLEIKEDQVIVGKELAESLGLDLNDDVFIFSPFQAFPFRLSVKGIFSSGMYDYDLNLIYTNISTAQKIFGLKDNVSGLGVKLKDLYLAQSIKEEIFKSLGYEFGISTWIERNRTFFAALKLEKIAMFIILTLIILVASFNIIGTLTVMVVNRAKDMGILRAIGFSKKAIQKIFLFKGILMGISGVIFGTILGILLCESLKRYQFIKLPKDIYYLDRLPVAMRFWPDLISIVFCAFLIVLVSTVYPARKASNLNLAEILRYE